MNNKGHRYRFVVLSFFVVSGATGLLLEVVWTRILGTVFGNTVYAASTVLTAYMLGLALGSVVLGRIADKSPQPLKLYGMLEVGVGVYALFFPLLVGLCDAVYGWFFRAYTPGFALMNTVRFPLSLLLLLPPTFFMGGTLPVLSRYLERINDEPGREVGYLYGANTLGAVVGCFVTGFVLLRIIGVQNTLYVASIMALGVGFSAIILGKYAANTKRAAPAGKNTKRNQRKASAALAKTLQSKLSDYTIQPGVLVLLIVAFGLTGFCSLAYEVLWTRVLIFVLTTNVYAFPTMLTTFLVGIALGSFLSSRFLLPRIRQPIWWFGLMEILIGFFVLLSIPLLAHLERIDFWLSSRLHVKLAERLLLIRFADVFVIFLAPTMLMGAVFPVVARACLGGMEQVGRRVGQIYASNTIGCVLGSFSAGFIFLPLLGTHRSLILVVIVNLVIGSVLLWKAWNAAVFLKTALTTAVLAVAVAALFLIPRDIFYRTLNTYHNTSKIVFAREHSTGTVTVHDVPNGERLICVSGVDVAGRDFMLRTTQKLQGYIPLILHPNPQRVAQIGFGSGETTRVGLEFPVPDYTIIEICPAVFEAGKFFEEINHGSYRNPRLRKIIMDGKNFAKLSAEKFDIVMNDSVYPGSSGGSALYTVDHFRNCRNRLKPGGLFSCWVPIDLRPSELRMILKSFQAVFPHTSFWMASNCLNKHALILGSLEPLKLDLRRIQTVMDRPHIKADLDAIALDNAYDLLDCLILDEQAILELVQNDPLNTDDHPRLAFSCAIPVPAEGTLGAIFAMLEQYRRPVEPYVYDFINPEKDRRELSRRFQATNHILKALSAQILGYANARAQQFFLARKANPTEKHIATCEAELEREIHDLRQALERLPGNKLLSFRLADKLYMAAYFDMVMNNKISSPDLIEAADMYARLIDVSPDLSPEIFIHLAEIKFRIKQPAQAEALLKRCLAIWPDSAEAHDKLAGIYFRSKQIDSARFHSAQALRLAPNNPIYKKHYRQITRAN